MAWSPIESPQDWILFGGSRSPGIADIDGAELKWRLDVVKLYGMTGGYIRFTGRELCKFSVRLRFYEQQDWDVWEVWSKIVTAKPTVTSAMAQGAVVTKDGAKDIYHPLLQMVGITAAVVESVAAPKMTHESGEWTVIIKLIEFRGIPKVQMAKAEGAKAEPVDPYDQQVIAKREQRDGLANR